MKPVPLLTDEQYSELMRYVRREDSGCWIYSFPSNYGNFSVNGVAFLAHRLVWRKFNREIPEGHFICHHCDNPPCVNPEHLFSGTAADNNRDMHYKLAQAGAQRRRLTESEVREIFWLYGPARAIAKKFKISAATVSAIHCGATWRKLGLPVEERRKRVAALKQKKRSEPVDWQTIKKARDDRRAQMYWASQISPTG